MHDAWIVNGQLSNTSQDGDGAKMLNNNEILALKRNHSQLIRMAYLKHYFDDYKRL